MSRKQARASSLQILYQIDVGKIEPQIAINNVITELGNNEAEISYVENIVYGVTEKLETIDNIIKEVAIDWNINRMAKVDRNILRLSIYEILFDKTIPDSVAINEGVELAKVFSDHESGKFINGILGKVLILKDKFVTV